MCVRARVSAGAGGGFRSLELQSPNVGSLKERFSHLTTAPSLQPWFF